MMLIHTILGFTEDSPHPAQSLTNSGIQYVQLYLFHMLSGETHQGVIQFFLTYAIRNVIALSIIMLVCYLVAWYIFTRRDFIEP